MKDWQLLRNSTTHSFWRNKWSGVYISNRFILLNCLCLCLLARFYHLTWRYCNFESCSVINRRELVQSDVKSLKSNQCVPLWIQQKRKWMNNSLEFHARVYNFTFLLHIGHFSRKSSRQFVWSCFKTLGWRRTGMPLRPEPPLACILFVLD